MTLTQGGEEFVARCHSLPSHLLTFTSTVKTNTIRGKESDQNCKFNSLKPDTTREITPLMKRTSGRVIQTNIKRIEVTSFVLFFPSETCLPFSMLSTRSTNIHREAGTKTLKRVLWTTRAINSKISTFSRMTLHNPL